MHRSASRDTVTFFLMENQIQILSVEKDDSDGLIVTFSDSTTAGYVVEELLELRPHREPTLLPQPHSPDILGGENRC